MLLLSSSYAPSGQGDKLGGTFVKMEWQQNRVSSGNSVLRLEKTVVFRRRNEIHIYIF
jgi:hypothetical protein